MAVNFILQCQKIIAVVVVLFLFFCNNSLAAAANVGARWEAVKALAAELVGVNHTVTHSCLCH